MRQEFVDMAASDCTVVTGAASGMGLSVARRLVDNGENVVAVDRDVNALATVFSADDHVHCVACDLGTDEGFISLTQAIKNIAAPVKGFVHCAGFVRTAPLGYVLSADARALYDVHALFPIKFLGWLTKKSNRAETVSCVLISSMACHEGDRGNVAYAAAKGAVEGFLRCAASELVSKKVRVNALVLGVVDTPLAHGAWMDKASDEQVKRIRESYPLGFGTTNDIANIVEFFLSDKSSWITGQTLICDGGHSLV